MSVVPPQTDTLYPLSQPPAESQATETVSTSTSQATRVSQDSFVSAKENLAGQVPSSGEPQKLEVHVLDTVISPQAPAVPPKDLPRLASPVKVPVVEDEQLILDEVEEDAMDLDELQSPSDGPSPVKILPRKSSLTFSSLPAREPLGKTSFGARASHVEASKSFGPSVAHLGHSSGLRTTVAPSATSFSSMEAHNATSQLLDSDASETLKLHNKTSTQRLHDRINMLSQSREVRPSKSFHTSTDKQLYPSFTTQDDVHKLAPNTEKSTAASIRSHHEDALSDDDDEWIAPISKTKAPSHQSTGLQIMQSKDTQLVEQVSNRLAGLQSPQARQGSPSRPFTHQKMASTTLLASPTKVAMAPEVQKPISVSNPPNLTGHGSTTPLHSPPRSPSGRKLLDGPLSTSKAQLKSLLKSAKGIFASSAGASAQAKMEALSSTRSPQHYGEALRSPFAESRNKPNLYPGLSALASESPLNGERRTRSSTEREHKRKAEEQQRASDELERARERERQKAADAAAQRMNRALPASKVPTSRAETPSRAGRADTQESDDVFHDAKDDMPPPPPPKSMLPTTNARMNQTRRVPVPRPTQQVATKTKPAPVTIRMPSQRIGQVAQPSSVQPSNNALNSSLHETLAPAPPPKTASNSKTSGLTTHLNSSTSSIKSSNPSAKRALEAAAKKKEQEAKVAQRKAEQKRELEQKRAQRLEEERKREEQRKVAEQQRLQEMRRAAQRQAEVKRQEREELQKREAPRPVSRQNAAAPTAIHSAARGDVGQARPISKMNIVQDPPRTVIQVNPAKPPKRALPVDSESRGLDRPVVQRNPPSYQQLDAKRRKTEDQEVAAETRGSVMGPPVRQSNIRKVCVDHLNHKRKCPNIYQEPSKYTHGYTSTHTTPHQKQSMLIKTVTSQHHQQQIKTVHQGEMAKYANGHIPFASGSNQQTAPPPQYGNQFKTPARPNPAATLSPYYTPGENIELPDIPSDSEDEDSENEWIAPSWTESPALREALRSQQLVDPEAIFGPIGPLNMEEVFRENKDRLKKFRKRTSSANWNGIDRLTDSERKRDRVARERMEIDGGWDFQSQRAAMTRKSPKPL
jgi:hypothetical protein